MTTVRWSLNLASAVLVAAGLVAAPASAEDPKAFYKDKTVKIIVGFGAGGGYDAYARMLAPHLKKIIGTNVIVENQPGAGGISALNRLYKAPPDGLQMIIIQGTGSAMQQLLDQKAVRFDLTNVGYLGIVSASPWMWLVKQTSTYRSPADAIKADTLMTWPGTGPIDGLSDGAAITCHTLKLKCKIVRGYKGSAAAALALAQGEMDAMYVSDTSAYKYVQAKNAHAIATMGRERSRFFKDVPTIFELVKLDTEQQWWFDFRSTMDALGRIMIVPPGLPADRLKFLQDAYRKMLTDPAVIAEGEKGDRYIAYVEPEKSKQMVVSVVSGMSAERKEQVRKVILGK